uniref:Carbonic anhydrase n=1 Tax=Timema shepardi TaxID=629360 RepID=A0A7R9ALQ7_TIMSH|nr:unnamed protein product [Timema shepardi]
MLLESAFFIGILAINLQINVNAKILLYGKQDADHNYRRTIERFPAVHQHSDNLESNSVNQNFDQLFDPVVKNGDPFPSPPPHTEVAKMARFIVHNSDWAALSYISAQPKSKGYPSGAIFSVSDGVINQSTGVPYLYVTKLELPIQDLRNDSRCSLTMTLAQSPYCQTQGLDPEEPPCAQLVLTGRMVQLENGTLDWNNAKEALFSRHPRMKDWPAGQKLWSKQHPECGGKLQSPIHLVAHKAIPLPLPALEMVRYHNPLPQPIVFTNNGHSVSVSVNPLEYDQLPMIFGAMLPNMYQLDSFHFHWGSKNNQGSEHVLNGIQYPAEMHIIHRNTRYSSVQEAQHFSHGLTVLAFFFQLRDKVNQALSPLIDNLPSVRKDGKSIPLNISLTLASILPRDKEVYYTYRGSLTTPPCSEAVTWIVFPEAIFLSYYQMKKFRQLSSGDTQLVDNFRRAQRLGPRKVYVRRMKQGEATMYNVTQYYPTFLTKT